MLTRLLRGLHSSAPSHAVSSFRMPAMSPTMSEGSIAAWKMKEGDAFAAGDVLLEIETDKATIDVEAQDDGILGKILMPAGSKNIPIGNAIALLAEEGDDITNLEAPQDMTPVPQVATPPVATEQSTSPREPVPHVQPTHSRTLFPSVHRLLVQHNVHKPDAITGTGVRGMLTKGDVLSYLGKASGPTGTFKPLISVQRDAPLQAAKEEQKPLDGPSLRRLIVSNMLQPSLKSRTTSEAPSVANFESVIEGYLSADTVKSHTVSKSSNITSAILMLQDSDDARPILKASVHDVRYLTALLRGVNFSNRATVTVTGTGITITVEEARTLLGTAFIFATLFDEYAFLHARCGEAMDSSQATEIDNMAFEIPLNTVIECLNIFGSAGMSSSAGGSYKAWKTTDGEPENDEGENDNDRNKQRRDGVRSGRGIESYFGGGSEKRTSMRLSYAGPGYPLTFILAEDASGPTTTCEITTFEPEPMLDLEFDNSKLLLKIILKSSWLRDALMELDPSCEKITFISNPPTESTAGIGRRKSSEKPILRIQAEGSFGSTQMDYPNDKDVLETFECVMPLEFSYRFAHINRTLRALQSSTKTSLRIDDEGLLSLQFLMPSPKIRLGHEEETPAFIEYRCLALDET
ncbi:hypothetical protein APHAL10511_007108 [Amanita phalloides]|nr:hypothetical protein APHAL10511_007108 [Amanita phalloides]